MCVCMCIDMHVDVMRVLMSAEVCSGHMCIFSVRACMVCTPVWVCMSIHACVCVCVCVCVCLRFERVAGGELAWAAALWRCGRERVWWIQEFSHRKES